MDRKEVNTVGIAEVYSLEYSGSCSEKADSALFCITLSYTQFMNIYIQYTVYAESVYMYVRI